MALAANLAFVARDITITAQRVDALAQVGFRSFEGALADFRDPDVQLALSEHGARVVLANSHMGDLAAGDRGIAALAERRSEFRDSFAADLHLAVRLKCSRLHVMAGLAPDRAQGMAVFRENLSWAVDLAARSDIEIVVEPISTVAMPGYLIADMSDFAMLRKDRGSDVGLLFDIYHLSNMGLDAMAQAHAAKDLIRHVQIADPVTRGLPAANDPVVNALVATLRRLCPEAGFGLECHVSQDQMPALQAYHDVVAPA